MKKTLLLLLCILIVSAEESNFWPSQLALHVSCFPVDSNSIAFTEIQELNNNTYSATTGIIIMRNDSSRFIMQNASYKVLNDHTLAINKHLLNLSGKLNWKRWSSKDVTVGIDWSPRLFITREENASNGVCFFRIGPHLNLNYENLPIEIRGGFSADLWQENISLFNDGSAENKYANQIPLFDAGFYGGILIGDNRKQLIDGIPIYAQGAIDGSYMDSVRITRGDVNLLFTSDLSFIDTLYIFVADTLSIGRTAFFGESDGAVQYSTTQNRTNHLFNGAIGLKRIGKRKLRPSIAYSLNSYSQQYDIDSGASTTLLGDKRLLSHSCFISVDNSEPKLFEYKSGIKLQIDAVDWLQNAIIPDTTFLTVQNRDSLIKNIDDYKSTFLQTHHRIRQIVSEKMEIAYAFYTDKYSRRFPNVYIDTAGISADTSISEDRDKTNITHAVDIFPVKTDRVIVGIHSEYTRTLNVYLSSERSSRNDTSRIYLVEAILSINPEKEKTVTEKVGIVGRTSQYMFRKFVYEQDVVTPPSSSRRFYSKLSFSVPFNKFIALGGLWNEIYWDDGYWVDEFYPYSTDNSSYDYYAIESKSLESSGELFFKIRLHSMLKATVGFWCQNHLDWRFNYELNNWRFTTRGMRIFDCEPFVSMKGSIGKNVKINAILKPHFEVVFAKNNNGGDITSDATFKYWEALASLQVRF